MDGGFESPVDIRAMLSMVRNGEFVVDESAWKTSARVSDGAILVSRGDIEVAFLVCGCVEIWRGSDVERMRCESHG